MFLSFHVEDPTVRGQFIQMMAADADFLRKSNIMDYSLLLGVVFHIPHSTEDGRTEEPTIPDSSENLTTWSRQLHCWAGIEDPVGLINSGAHDLWIDIFKHSNHQGRVVSCSPFAQHVPPSLCVHSARNSALTRFSLGCVSRALCILE